MVTAEESEPGSVTAAIARLEARVAALESALERRSRELRIIQQHVCLRDLALIARVVAGLPPLPPATSDPLFWQESTRTTATDVQSALEGLWQSLVPSDDGLDGS